MTKERDKEGTLVLLNAGKEPLGKEDKGDISVNLVNCKTVLIRVPAIVHWPNQISSGKENGLMSTLDVLPTVMGSFGFESSMLDNVVMDG